MAESVPILTRGATFSACGDYRYDLTRRLATGNGSVTFVMLNPSTADAHQEDPTIRRCLGFARDWGYANVRILNLFALRSTDPKGLRGHIDPVGPLNDEFLARYCAPNAAMRVVVAWGTHGDYMGRGLAVLQMLRRRRGETGGLCALGWNKNRSPKHPLYIKGDCVPQPVVANGPPPDIELPTPEEYRRRLDELRGEYEGVVEDLEKQTELPPPGDPFWTTPFGCAVRGAGKG